MDPRLPSYFIYELCQTCQIVEQSIQRAVHLFNVEGGLSKPSIIFPKFEVNQQITSQAETGQ